MTLFILLSIALAAIVLLLVMPTLLRRLVPAKDNSADKVNITIYRDQLRELDEDLAAGTIDGAQHAEARAELERRLLEDTAAGDNPVTATAPHSGRLTAAILAVLIPLAATGLYLAVGTPAGLAPEQARAGGGHDITPQQVEEMVANLAARLKQSPENGEGWVMLGRSYAALERFSESAAAYAEAAKRIPGDAQLLVDYADVLAMSQGRRLAGEPEKLVQRALAIDPANPKALALAGTAAFDRKQYATAVKYWQKLADSLPAESEIMAALQSSIAEAKALAGGAKPDVATSDIAKKEEAAPKSAAAPAPAQVSGSVDISAQLKARASPDDTVFIFARAENGPPAPLAVMRRRVADLPMKFMLDDSMAMAPGMNLSKFGNVIVGARISKSGKPARQPGDLEGFSKTVKVGTTGISVVIDTEVR